MFFKKKPSWYWLTMWALVFAGFVFGIARFFLHAVDKESREKPKKQAKKTSSSAWEELFV
jgi:phosphotransferase system  glucose/maltose/N-acetylglucosamine-specific IIC component